MANNPWALPTTGNLAYDDYNRSKNAWFKAYPYTGAHSNITSSDAWMQGNDAVAQHYKNGGLL